MDIGNFNHLTQEQKNTQLLEVAKNGKTEEVDGLIKAGANLDAVVQYGYTALMGAAIHGHTDIVRLLIQAKANLDTVDNDGNTALIEAAWNGQADSVALLIQAKANLEAIGTDGHTALSCAISQNHPDIVNLLFSVMTPEQVRREINCHPNLDILAHFNNFGQAVIAHRMAAFKTLGPLALDFNEHNLFSFLPTEVMSMIAPYYCALGDKAWHAPHAGLDGLKVYDAMVKNGPLTFSSTAPNIKKRKAGELEEERDVKKIKITSLEKNDDSSEENMSPESNSWCTIL